MASAYEDGSDTSEGSTGTGNLASVGASALATLPAARVSLRTRLRITGSPVFRDLTSSLKTKPYKL